MSSGRWLVNSFPTAHEIDRDIVDATVISQANGQPLGLLGWISTSCSTLLGSGYFCTKRLLFYTMTYKIIYVDNVCTKITKSAIGGAARPRPLILKAS